MKGLGGVWIGMFAPKGTPRPIINKLADNFKKMTQDKRAIAGIKAMGADFDYLPDPRNSKRHGGRNTTATRNWPRSYQKIRRRGRAPREAICRTSGT